MFSKKLKDVTEKTNIRQFSKIMLSSISVDIVYCQAINRLLALLY